MFQNLLADRFKLVIHSQTANLPVYALVVAKGGLKIKKAAPQEGAGSTPVDSDVASTFDAFYGTVQSRTIPGADGSDSVTIISKPRMGTVRQTGDPYRGQRWEAPNISFAGLADLLDNVAPFLSLPVIDMTGIGGRYNLALEVSLEDLRRHAGLASEPAGPGNAGDMEEIVLSAFNNGLLKLGLRLEHRKGPLETVVVDRVEKTPTEN
ncbi:MAG TPA: TIGR03435 family protein [Bryobacteraceae bacterium]